jgi:hypothetical protein
MPSETEIIITFLFKRSGKLKLPFSELYLTLSMDLNWFTPDDAKAFVNLALKQKLLTKKEEFLKPSFEYEKIVVPVGFVPSKQIFKEKRVEKPKEKTDILDKIISQIAEETYLGTQEVSDKIIDIAQEKNITKDVAAILVGKEYNLNLEDFFDKVEERIFYIK